MILKIAPTSNNSYEEQTLPVGDQGYKNLCIIRIVITIAIRMFLQGTKKWWFCLIFFSNVCCAVETLRASRGGVGGGDDDIQAATLLLLSVNNYPCRLLVLPSCPRLLSVNLMIVPILAPPGACAGLRCRRAIRGSRSRRSCWRRFLTHMMYIRIMIKDAAS